MEINGYDVEVPVAEHLIVMIYTDRPGIVAVYGREFGEAGINIAGMQISRREAGGQALSVLTVDSPVPDGLLETVRVAIQADLLGEIDITDSTAGRGVPFRASPRLVRCCLQRGRSVRILSVPRPLRSRIRSCGRMSPCPCLQARQVVHDS